MKFQFSIQQYQTDAVNAVVDVFAGQGLRSSISYTQDLGNLGIRTLGEKNADVMLFPEKLLENLRSVQHRNEIKLSSELVKSQLGACVLDVEMETGTGKTYVYIKTMFELNKRYGWNKFIVVVPSVAIREGVAKSFQVFQRALHGSVREEGPLLCLQQQAVARHRFVCRFERTIGDDYQHAGFCRIVEA